MANLDKAYQEFLTNLKARITSSRYTAARAVNSELILLYWDIGNSILEKQAHDGWGAKVIEHLAQDLKTSFEDMKGFSVRNLKYMRLFADKWRDKQIVQQLAAQLPWAHNMVLLIHLTQLILISSIPIDHS
jgi:predicted nuclease of restriction endonuclease-like (RecB) superfamily